MTRLLVPIVIAVGGIASGLFLGYKLMERQPVVAIMVCSSEIAFSVSFAVYLYFEVLA